MEKTAAKTPDSLAYWIARFQKLAVAGLRSEAVARKIKLHLDRFQEFFVELYGHERISTCMQRDVRAWQKTLHEVRGYAPATVNNYLASLSAFCSWVQVQDPRAFHTGDPSKGVSELALPALEPRALDEQQVQSLKNLCDRLDGFYRLKGRRSAPPDKEAPLRLLARPWRDRAIVFVLLSTGLRREELVRLNLDQLEPNTASALRKARQARITRVRGKGQTERNVFLSADARSALADYLDQERDRDAAGEARPLFLAALGPHDRSSDGRLSPRSINRILEQIGRWHDAEFKDKSRHISPLRPHDLRHTFAFALSQATGADAYELERRLGHRSQRYIQRYTNPPRDVAAGYVEEF